MELNTEYKLIYDGNGGTGGPEPVIKLSNEHYVIFSASEMTPRREGYIFSGWSLSREGETWIFGGDYFSVTARETTLYAMWTKADEEAVVVADATTEAVEPLGVFSESNGNSNSGVGVSVGMSFILAAVILGAIALIFFRAKEPRILSIEEIDEKK